MVDGEVGLGHITGDWDGERAVLDPVGISEPKLSVDSKQIKTYNSPANYGSKVGPPVFLGFILILERCVTVKEQRSFERMLTTSS